MMSPVSGPRAVAVCVAAALAFTAFVLAWAEKSPAAHEDCTLSGGAPISYGGIFAIA